MNASSNVRILAPTGKIGYVPKEKLPEAIAAGATVLTLERMRELRQAIFMEHAIFDDKKPKPLPPRHRRKSLWKRGAR